MKQLLRIYVLIILFSAVGMRVPAQTDTNHTPRNGDRLHPGIASSRGLILSVNDSTRTVLIDPSAVSFDDERDASVYIDGDTISYVQFATKHRFTLSGDTLSYIGYENRARNFRLDRPVKVAVFPLKDGDRVICGWSGHMLQYGAMMLKHVKGISGGEVQRGWTLTDGTDTLRNTVRLRWILNMSYADPDSVDKAMPDSVASDLMSEMRVDPKAMLSKRLLTETTMWFAEDARYPVLTDSRVSRILLDDAGLPKDTVALTMLAMHYPSSYQRSDTGEDIQAEQPSSDHADNGEAPYGDGNGNKTLTIGEPEINGNTVTVTLSSQSGPVSATVMLFTDSGIRLTEPLTVTVGAVPQSHATEIPSGWSGVMLLRVEAGEESYTEKIIR